MANGKTFQYFGHDIPLNADADKIKQYAEEISIEKKMDVSEVEFGIRCFQEAARKSEQEPMPPRVGAPVMFC